MNGEPDLRAPTCGNVMELLTGDEEGSLLRVCSVCATLAWNGKAARSKRGNHRRLQARRSGDFWRTENSLRWKRNWPDYGARRRADLHTSRSKRNGSRSCTFH